MNEEITPYFPHPYKKPSNATQTGIAVFYGFEPLEQAEMEEMVKEAEHTGQSVIVRDLRKSNQAVGIKVEYVWHNIELEITILTTTKSRIHVPDMEQHLIEAQKKHESDTAGFVLLVL